MFSAIIFGWFWIAAALSGPALISAIIKYFYRNEVEDSRLHPVAFILCAAWQIPAYLAARHFYPKEGNHIFAIYFAVLFLIMSLPGDEDRATGLATAWFLGAPIVYQWFN